MHAFVVPRSLTIVPTPRTHRPADATFAEQLVGDDLVPAKPTHALPIYNCRRDHCRRRVASDRNDGNPVIPSTGLRLG
jgi:hypothetical protein